MALFRVFLLGIDIYSTIPAWFLTSYYANMF